MRLYRTPLPSIISEASTVEPPDLVHLSHRYAELLMAEYQRRDRSEHQPSFHGVAARLGIVHGLSSVMKTDPRFLAAPQLFCLQAARGEPVRVATGASTALAFVHIDDAVEGLLRCRSLDDRLAIANVASEVRSVASVAEAVRAAGRDRGLDVQIQYLGRNGRHRERSIRSRLDATGFVPSRRFEDSVGPVLDHYLAAESR
jgi:nucleoside-diphosphate-sugar epimerase